MKQSASIEVVCLAKCTWAGKDQATKNMLKALRLFPHLNTPIEWARLHVTEAAMKLK